MREDIYQFQECLFCSACRHRVENDLKEIQVHWSLSRTYAILTLFCCTWVTVIMLSSVLTKHWPVWHQKRGGRRLTAKLKHEKVEEEQFKSVTSSTALNIGQSTFLSCKFLSSYLLKNRYRFLLPTPLMLLYMYCMLYNLDPMSCPIHWRWNVFIIFY